MNIERYLVAYYPISHRTSVTRRILLALLAILLIPTMVMHTISSIVFAISNEWHLLIIRALFLPPFIFVNIKLLIIVGKVRPERAVSDEKRKRKNLKNISTALWVVAYSNKFPHCIRACSQTYKHHKIVLHLNAHMFHHEFHIEQFDIFWRNKVLRTEGINISSLLKRNISSLLLFLEGINISSLRILNKNLTLVVRVVFTN